MPGCGWRTFKEEETEALTLRHSLLQKLQLKYTRSLVDRFKIPLDISIVDNTSDGFNWYFISRVGGTIFI